MHASINITSVFRNKTVLNVIHNLHIFHLEVKFQYSLTWHNVHSIIFTYMKQSTSTLILSSGKKTYLIYVHDK